MVTKRPSFLKRQKEQKRNARALEKREARRGRKESKMTEQDHSTASDHLVEGTETTHDTQP